MTTLIALTCWISGGIVGFALGLHVALNNAAFARGFLKGCTSPWEKLK